MIKKDKNVLLLSEIPIAKSTLVLVNEISQMRDNYIKLREFIIHRLVFTESKQLLRVIAKRKSVVYKVGFTIIVLEAFFFTQVDFFVFLISFKKNHYPSSYHLFTFIRTTFTA